MTEEIKYNLGQADPEAIIMDIAETAQAVGSKDALRAKSSGNKLVDLYRKFNLWLANSSRVRLTDRVTYFQLLSVLLNAGVPLIRSLYILADQFKNPKLKTVIAAIAQRVEHGSRLSDAMADYPKVFSEAQVGMVAAGEASGNMNNVLTQSAKQLESTAKLVSKVKGAMVYPIAIFILLMAVSAMMMIYIVPKITVLFEGTGIDLPTITKVVIFISDILRERFVSLAVVIGLIVFLILSWGKTPNGRYHLDKLKLRLPVFGLLLRQVAVARFGRTFSSMLTSGIPVVKGLQIVAESVGNAAYREKILGVAEDVQRGIPIAENLGTDPFLFPQTVVNMVAIGEQTAQLDEVLDKIADFYEERVNVTTNSLAKLMEPIIMVGMGVIVGGVVLAVLMPMIQLTDLAEAV